MCLVPFCTNDKSSFRKQLAGHKHISLVAGTSYSTSSIICLPKSRQISGRDKGKMQLNPEGVGVGGRWKRFEENVATQLGGELPRGYSKIPIPAKTFHLNS